MASLVLGAVGATIGGLVGGVAGAELGFAVGTTVGGLLFPPKMGKQANSNLKDLRVTGSGYGSVIPQIYGNMRLHGDIIWSTDLKLVSSASSGGKGGKPSSQRQTIYSVNCAIAVCRGPITQIKRIWAEDKVIYDVSLNPITSYTIRPYTGTETQLPDSLITGIEGVAQTPAYRGMAYCVFENWNLSTWGNRIPSCTFEVDTPGTTLESILTDLFGQVGLTASQFDVTAGHSEAVLGYFIQERQALRQTIDALLRCYKYDLVDIDGKVVLKARGGAPVVTIPAGDQGCRFGNPTSPPEQKVTVKRQQDMDLPFRVDLTYYSPARNFQQALQGSERYTKINLQDALTVQSELVLTDDNARHTAEQILYQQWLEREQFVVSVSFKYLYLSPGDVFDLVVGTNTLRVRIISMDIGVPGPIQLTCVLDDDSILTQTAVGAASVVVVDIHESFDTTITAWSGNAIRDADTSNVGFYVGLGGTSEWLGATLYMSKDSGSSYQIQETIVDPAVYGTATTILAAPNTSTVGTSIFDNTNTVDINLVSEEAPSSTSATDVLAGSNACMVGDELIQFTTITPLGGSAYRLSGLLRGRRGTDGHWTEHVIGERFIMLGVGQVNRFNFTDDMRGKTVLLKAVGTNQTLASVSPTSILITGDEFKCYNPVQVTASRDGSNNLTFAWVRRARLNAEMRDLTDIPLGETSEAYQIDVMSGSGGGATVLRTLTSATPTVSYTAAQQVTDFGSVQNPVTINVYQMGKFGRGFPAKATI